MSKKNKRIAHKYVTIGKVKVTITPKDQLLKHVQNSLDEKLIIYTPNPEMIVETKANSVFSKALSEADINLPDGFGLVLASKFLYGKDLKRIKGREFFLDLLKLAQKNKLKIFLIGSTDDVITKSIIKIKSEHPNISIRGDSGPNISKTGQPVSDKDINLQSDIVTAINNFSPDILLVAFGAPKQELWIQNNHNKLDAHVFMGIGGTLDYYVGKSILPPVIISTLGLEWLWRLTHQPKRFPRIIKAIVVFPLIIIKQKIKAF